MKLRITILALLSLHLSSICFAQVISSIVPSNANVGQSVTINGSGFGTNCSVTFNGATGNITSNSDTQIVVTVPTDATSGPVVVKISSGAVSAPYSFVINDQQFTIAASFVTSLGPNSQIYAQPNIVAGSNWQINNCAISFRVTGLFSNKDTTRYINATNLFKPEISNLCGRLMVLQRLKKSGGLSHFGVSFETNLFIQTLQSVKNSESITGSVTSSVNKIGLQFSPLDGMTVTARYQMLSNLTGKRDYQARFGSMGTGFGNWEIAALLRVQDGPLKNLYFQPSIIFCDDKLHQLLGTNDGAVVLIRIGYTAGF
jgi:hypothetical protein